MFNIYRFCLIVIHVIYYALLFIFFQLAKARKNVNLLFSSNNESDIKLVVHKVKRLSKLPNHIVFILSTGPHSFNDLAKLLTWSIASGISYISFYDYTGLLQRREEEFLNCLNYFEPLKPNLHRIIWNGITGVNGFSKKGHINYDQDTLPDVHVNVLSLIDCKKSLVNVASHLSHLVSIDKLKPSDINQELIQEVSRSQLDIPDPDLAVICGTTCCTYGLLPWHIRVTEFLQLPSHHNVTVPEFLGLLQTYAKVEQRFGK